MQTEAAKQDDGSAAVAAPVAPVQPAPTAWTCERQDGNGGDPNAGDDVYSDIYWAIHDERTYDFIANVHSNEQHARLIAAAPDLLGVLRDVAGMLPVAARLHPKDLAVLQSAVCAAIAKATASPAIQARKEG